MKQSGGGRGKEQSTMADRNAMDWDHGGDLEALDALELHDTEPAPPMGAEEIAEDRGQGLDDSRMLRAYFADVARASKRQRGRS